MNTKQSMIIANDRIVTSDISSCSYNNQTHKYDVTFKSGQTYHYNYSSVKWLKDPKALNPQLFHIFHGERELFDISGIYVFKDVYCSYWHMFFGNGTERDYKENDLKIVQSVLNDAQSKNVFEYLRQSANLCSLRGDDGTKLLPKQYEKLNFIGDDTALSVYLNPPERIISNGTYPTIIFPFGCNSSQFKAVKNALENQLSVIEGPPGTGKTQTILNIIANLLVANKTVQVVSNNNTAIENIFEKLASEKYQMDFMVAVLGKSANKKEFIESQNGQYPNLALWSDASVETNDFTVEFNSTAAQLSTVFVNQERLAIAKQELQTLETEKKHFEQYVSESTLSDAAIKTRKHLTSMKVMNLWQSCQNASDKRMSLSFFFKLKCRFLYGISDWRFYNGNIEKVITTMQSLFYRYKEKELHDEISTIELQLKSINAKDIMDKFTGMSMRYLKNAISHRYANDGARAYFSGDDLWKNPGNVLKEYPIILSTTFSSRSSLCKNVLFDYVIMDESSQVDVSTGALALSSAQNAVIVGDTKQLSNIVDSKKEADAIFNSFHISDGYHFAHKSFLSSVCEVIPNAPRTLLREHYRCHPRIINFCNQKFYNGELIIMTADKGESNVLTVVKTATGNHARGHLNQRQIDIIDHEILPTLSFQPENVGIIAPYNDQVNALINEKHKGIEVTTVHKFQGREKDAIILTTVDDETNNFTDDPYLLNVAISRAKKCLILVVSEKSQQPDSNIGDLISYVEYNNFSVTESKLYSIFDYLYSQYTEKRFEYLQKHKRISEFDSENLMYALITDSLKEFNISDWSVICRQPLNMLIRDPQLLNDDECKYAMNSATHLDFLIYNRISKKPALAIEVDGYDYHKSGTRQAERDIMKNHILELYSIPYMRFATNGSGEKEKLIAKIREIRK